MSDPPPAAPVSSEGLLRRSGLLLLAFGLLIACGPGAVSRDGSALAFLAVALWAAVASRPGRRAVLAEWLAGSLWGAATMFWAAYVWGPLLLWIGPGWGLYTVGAGALLRRIARRAPLALAAPLAFCAMEALRGLLPPPLGSAWLRLGHHALPIEALSGSLRAWGTEGLSFTLAALGGLVADLVLARRGGARVGAGTWALGLGPSALALLLGALTSPPPTEDGPRVLLVQPAFEQARKQRTGDPEALFREQLELTRAGLARAGPEAPDLVCWGETLLYAPVVAPGVDRRAAAGLVAPDWWELAPEAIPRVLAGARDASDARLAAVRRVLPPGTAFLCGAEVLVAEDGVLGRANGVAVWDGRGRRVGMGLKRFLVPGAETMLGLERFAVVRDFVREVAGYVPDFRPAPRTAVCALELTGGRVVRLGLSVCYDNAFPAPYLDPLRDGPLDVHAVVSNEAWYRGSFELDQMVAFSRAAALESGRAILRATNSGVSLAIGPDGRELARLEVGGLDRDVAGALAVRLPVPRGGAEAPRTPFSVLAPLLGWLWLLLPALLAPVLLRLPRRPSALGGPGA